MNTRVLLSAPPFSGHLNPLLVLGQGLRDRGYEIRVATGAAKAELCEELGFTTHRLFADDPGIFDRIANTSRPVRSNPLLLLRQLSANLDLLPRARSELDAALTEYSPHIVVADFTAPVAGMAAEARGVPWVTTIPTPFALETRTGTPSYCGGWGPSRHVGHRLRDAGGRLATRAVKKAMEKVLASRFRRAGTGVYRPDGSEAAYSRTAILGLGMTELEFARDWPSAFQMIGPVTATPEPWTQPPQLPEGSLVLVTVGTHLQWAKRDLVDRVQRLAVDLPGLTFVVSRGDGKDLRPTPVERRGRVVVFSHLPYDQVLPRCVAVIHHAGAGITYSAIRAGVPALVLPHDYDQFDYAARIVAAGAGHRIQRIETAATELRALLDADRSRLDSLARAARAYDPVAAMAATLKAVSGRWEGAGPGEAFDRDREEESSPP